MGRVGRVSWVHLVLVVSEVFPASVLVVSEVFPASVLVSSVVVPAVEAQPKQKQV